MSRETPLVSRPTQKNLSGGPKRRINARQQFRMRSSSTKGHAWSSWQTAQKRKSKTAKTCTPVLAKKLHKEQNSRKGTEKKKLCRKGPIPGILQETDGKGEKSGNKKKEKKQQRGEGEKRVKGVKKLLGEKKPESGCRNNKLPLKRSEGKASPFGVAGSTP